MTKSGKTESAEKNEIAGRLENVEAALSLAREELFSLEQQVKLARGTEDLTEQSRAVVGPATPAERVEAALRAHVLDRAGLAKIADVSLDTIDELITAAGPSVFNLGTGFRPRYTWVLGDIVPTSELTAAVLRLLQERPLGQAELVAATGARANRISGVITILKDKVPTRLINVGDKSRARWFVMPSEMEY